MDLNFADQVSLALSQARELAEALMVDSCVVEVPTGRKAQVESTGKESMEFETLFTSRCKVQDNKLATSDAEVGGRREVTATAQVHMPVGKPNTPQGARITITAVGAGSDPRLVGRMFEVGAPMAKTYATATRLNVKEYQEAE